MSSPRLCEKCHERPAEVPDRERMGRPIKRICGPCHRGEITFDVVAAIAIQSTEKRKREIAEQIEMDFQ